VSTDYGEKERQFLETLKADTGRALDEWMAAIAAEGLAHRNDVIDWLRRQGFMFSKASWLERIHNNGGRPIYEGTGGTRSQARPRSSAPRTGPQPHMAAQPQRLEAAPVAAPPPQQPPPAQPPAAPPSTVAYDPAALDAALSRAKGYRPLATFLISEIGKAAPGMELSPADGYVAFRIRGLDFALLAVSAKELRLALSLKEAAPPDPSLQPAKLAAALKGAPPMTHMAVLNDARQVTPSLLAAVAKAAAGA